MTLDLIASGSSVFLDANILIYHFTGEPSYGAASTRLIERVQQGDVQGFTSADVVSDAAHRMMTIEAMELLGWPLAGLSARLRRHHDEIAKLTHFQRAIEQLPKFGVRVSDVTYDLVLSATELSRRHELLSGDALIVATMQAAGLSQLASNDADFDRVPGLTRYAPA